MSKRQVQQTDNNVKRKPSKRERRTKVIIYVMVVAMVLSLFTAGLGGIVSMF